MAYQVGIDLGTTSTVAAVCRPDGTAHVVPLEGSAGAVPSVVHLGADGDLLVGGTAERRALSDPGRVVRELVRRVGDGTPLLVGREPVAAADLAARFLARIADDVARREGGVASRVAVTHPGSWGPHRVSALRAALAEHGLGSAVLVPEPVAAARATVAHVPPGAAVGVHDLGGGRFEAAVVRRTPAGFELAAVEERDGVGGADLDEVVFGHVRAALGAAWEALDPADPDVLAAVADLRRECTAAKEALSRDTEVLVPVALPGVRRQVRLGRAEFEEMIRPCVEETVEAMGRALDAASTSPADLGALVLVGGSAAIPLVPQLLGEAFGRDVTVAPDSVGAVAVGAALLARGPDAEPARPRGQGGLRPTVPVGARARLAVGEDVRREQRAGAAPASGPGTLPLVVGGAAALASGDSAASSPAAGPSSGTEVLPVARPPKQARPFTAAPAANSSRPRRIALLGSAAALAVAVLGGVVAFGVGRIGAGAEAGAVTPASVVDGGAASTSAPAPPAPTAAPEPPVRSGSAGAGRRTRQAVPPPPPASSVTPSPPPPTQGPPAGEEEETGTPQPTADPTEGGDNGGAGGNDGAGNGAGGNGAGGADAGGDAAGGEAGGGDGTPGDGAGGGSAQAADPAAAAAAPAAAAPGGAAPEAGADQPAR